MSISVLWLIAAIIFGVGGAIFIALGLKELLETRKFMRLHQLLEQSEEEED